MIFNRLNKHEIVFGDNSSDDYWQKKNESILNFLRVNWLVVVLILLFSITFYHFKKAYIPFNFAQILGLLFSPFLFRRTSHTGSIRYFIPALLLAILLLFFRSSTAYYFFFAFSILFIIEGALGKLNQIPLFLFIVISPIFQNITNIWSFPIRLELSAWAGKSLQFVQRTPFGMGWQAEAVGNVIYLNGVPFSVDPECMGLKMVSTALIIGLMVLAAFERNNRLTISFWKIGFALVVIVLLTILANFTRLLVLVVFEVMPDETMHHILGLISLTIYAVLPFYFFVIKSQFFKDSTLLIDDLESEKHLKKPSSKFYILSLVLFPFLIWNGQQFLTIKTQNIAEVQNINLIGYESSLTENGVLKLENGTTLIYIKPPVKPYQGSHDPRICWRGSGFEFFNIQITKMEGFDIYTAELRQKEHILHTAWWYDNGSHKTIGEWDWRWQMLKGQKGFQLINVSSSEKEILETEVRKLLNAKL